MSVIILNTFNVIWHVVNLDDFSISENCSEVVNLCMKVFKHQWQIIPSLITEKVKLYKNDMQLETFSTFINGVNNCQKAYFILSCIES